MAEVTLIEPDKRKLIKKSFPVTGMTCASCASSVESILQHTDGVSKASVNLATNSVLVEYDKALPTINLQKALQAIGYDLLIQEGDQTEAQEDIHERKYEEIKNRTIGSAILTLPVFIIGMFFMEWPAGRWISLAFTIPVIFWFGRSFFINAFKQARHGRANMDTLVALSTGIAFLFSFFNTLFPEFWHSKGLHAHVYYEAATVIITFISLGKLLEEKAKSKTSTAITKLMGLQPQTVKVIRDGKEFEITISEVQVGEIILVRPGEKIAVDGVVTEGSSFVNESMISGEPMPIEKNQGKKVFAGTINQKGSFQFTAEKVGEETLLAQIIKMVQQAQGSKAPVQNLVDKIATVFVPAVLAIAIITFIVWMVIGGENAFSHGLLTSISVLVIACPCALGLATPTAIMVGIGKGAENNILIKDAESLELGHRVNAMVLDKTGTITEGKPSVTDEVWVDENHFHEYAPVLLALESKSEHPLGEAIVQHLYSKNINPVSLHSFKSITGFGVEGVVDSKKFVAGNHKHLSSLSIIIPDQLMKKAVELQEHGKTAILFANENHPLALFGIADKIKPTSAQAIQTMQKQGIEVHLLTGDNAHTAEAVARQVGIKHFKAEALPSDKENFVKRLQQEGKIVAMVGDGINDSQALAQADVSIAMGHGTDIAMDVASITLITSDLEYIPKALQLSKRTVRGVRQNLFWAFIYNLIGIPIAAGILFPLNGFLLDPMIAGGAMAFSSVSVVANSLRLKSIKL